MYHVNKSLSWFLLILVCLSLSAGVVAQEGGVVTLDPGDIPEEGNCAITLEGQDFITSGAEGAFVSELPELSIPIEADAVRDLINESMPESVSLGVEPVAILIVDDFGGNDPSEEGAFDSMDLSSETEFPHGALVKQHTQRLLEAFNKNRVVPANNITVHEVDIGDFATNSIVGGIRDTITRLAGPGSEIKRFVVNMSFTLLPCLTVKGYLTWELEYEGEDEGFRTYFADVTGDNTVQGWHNFMAEQLAQVAGDEPMMGCLDRNRSTCTENIEFIVFVAAAGNFGDKFSYLLFPGAWPEVVSVSGQVFDGSTPWLRWPFSNNGEVIAPAAWYGYSSPSTTPDVEPAAFYAGTSFAAPVASIVAALHLAIPSSPPPPLPPCPFDAFPPLFASYAYDQTFASIRQIFC